MSREITHYFAYGSNMNPARVRERGLLVRHEQGARLRGYRLVFDKVAAYHPDVAHANIISAPGDVVEGVLYDLHSTGEILKMDRFERAPINYGREVVYVEAASGTLAAWTYFANDAVRVSGRRPSAEYMGHLLAGQPYLSEAYYQTLKKHEIV